MLTLAQTRTFTNNLARVFIKGRQLDEVLRGDEEKFGNSGRFLKKSTNHLLSTFYVKSGEKSIIIHPLFSPFAFPRV